MTSTTDLKACFLDLLMEVGEGADPTEVLAAFENAITDWMQYHEDAAAKYRDLHGRFLTGRKF